MSNQQITEEVIREALQQVPYPGMSRDIVSFGMVKEIRIDGNSVQVDLSITTTNSEVKPTVEKEATSVLQAIEGIGDVKVEMTALDVPQPKVEQPRYFANIPRVIAVASGKGGVGKSTVASNLAVTYAREGLRTALLDADIYGPSMQLMMGVEKKPDIHNEKMIPPRAHDVFLMSLGLLVDTDQAMIWRGPMVMQAFEQIMRDTEWPELDVMIIDLPPGTGDVQLSLSQQVNVTGAVIVTTPQNVALIDARKAVNMFQKVEVPIIGFIENMSYYHCPHCGERDYIFSQEGGKATAAGSGHLLLGEIPLDVAVRKGGDEGVPSSLTNDMQKQIYSDIFSKIEKTISGWQ